MTVRENIQAQLDTLLEQGSLPKSGCSASLMRCLKPLIDSGVVVDERSGAGRRMVVSNNSALANFIHTRFPNAEVPQETPNRIAALARFRDTKALRTDTRDVVVLRSWSDVAMWREHRPVPVATATREHGTFSFVLTPDSPYELRTACALVENPTVLLDFERLGLSASIPVALYAGGRTSRRVLQWLASQTASTFSLLHLPDYDPVGLNEFLRVRAALGTRARLHVPENLAKAFARFGNSDLVRRESSPALIRGLRQGTIPEVRGVLDLIEHHNAGLEQEALLVAIDAAE